jgi:hypothetical protein
MTNPAVDFGVSGLAGTGAIVAFANAAREDHMWQQHPVSLVVNYGEPAAAPEPEKVLVGGGGGYGASDAGVAPAAAGTDPGAAVASVADPFAGRKAGSITKAEGKATIAEWYKQARDANPTVNASDILARIPEAADARIGVAERRALHQARHAAGFMNRYSDRFSPGVHAGRALMFAVLGVGLTAAWIATGMHGLIGMSNNNSSS